MVEETIQTIRETEAKADSILREAQQQSEKILEEATKKAAILKEEKLQAAKTQAEQSLEHARAKGIVLQNQSADDVEDAVKALKADALQKQEAAVSLVISKLIQKS